MIPPTRHPRPHRRVESCPFATGDQWRPLRLLLDDDTLEPTDIEALLHFGHYDEVELVRTSADALPRLEIKDASDDFVAIHEVGEHGSGVFWIWHAARKRATARAVAAESGIEEEEAFRALVFAAASEEMEADGFVTRRGFLRIRGSGSDSSVYTPDEALALIGLALRLHGNESIGADLMNLRLIGPTFHFVLARELTHEGWRWFSGCVRSSRATGADTAINLGQAALERLQRVLQVRDRMHRQAKLPSSPSVGDELVFQFETLMLFLSATFDAVARVAHLVYLGNDYEDAGWRKGRWHEQLKQAEPALAALVADGTTGGTVLTLISRMRNTIHGEALRTLTLQRGGSSAENPVALNEKDALRSAVDIELLGEKPSDWGLREEHGRTYLTVDRYAESLLPHAISLLNVLMAGTAVDRLAGVDASQLMQPPANVPSSDPIKEMLSFEVRRRARQLGGF